MLFERVSKCRSCSDKERRLMEEARTVYFLSTLVQQEERNASDDKGDKCLSLLVILSKINAYNGTPMQRIPLESKRHSLQL